MERLLTLAQWDTDNAIGAAADPDAAGDDAIFFSHKNSLFSYKMHSFSRPPHSFPRPPPTLFHKFSPRAFFTPKRLQLFGHNPDVPTAPARPPIPDARPDPLRRPPAPPTQRPASPRLPPPPQA